MIKEIQMPKFGQTMEEGTIVNWEIGIGDYIEKGALLLEIESDKATLEVRVTNTSAQDLYHKLGFEMAAIRKHFYSDTGEDAYVMWIPDLRDRIEELQLHVWRTLREKEERV